MSQDIDHVLHCHKLLNKYGTLIAVMSSSTMTRTDKKSIEFRKWVDDNSGEFFKLPDGSFKSSLNSTGVNSCYLVI